MSRIISGIACFSTTAGTLPELRPLFINLPVGLMLVEANRGRSCPWRSQSWRTVHLYRRQPRGRMLARKGAAWLEQEHT